MNFDLMILNRLTVCLLEMPFMSTEQAARFFPHLKWAQKEASKYLKELEREKIVEGYDRRVGESKIWRLSLKGKKLYEINKRAVPFTVRNIAHHLGLMDCYLDLREIEGGLWIEGELREEFTNRFGKERKYCPDAFFLYQKQPYFLELQRSYLSRLNWGEKWKIANEFFGEGHMHTCSVAGYLEGYKAIPIVVVTDQREEVVKSGADVPLIVVKNFKEIASMGSRQIYADLQR